MADPNTPWGRGGHNRVPKGGRRGSWLWLSLVAAIALLVWLLLEIFPQRELDTTEWAQLTKLGLILVLCSSGLLFLRRVPVGETVRNLATWAGIAGALMLGYTLRHDFADLGNRLIGELVPSRAVETAEGVVEVRAGMAGHFIVTAMVNGQPVDFLIDTGASDIVLSPADARRVGYDLGDLSFTRQYQTANGVGRGAPVRLDRIAVGAIAFEGLPASVNQAPLANSLLGMTFLRRLESYEVRRDAMILRR